MDKPKPRSKAESLWGEIARMEAEVHDPEESETAVYDVRDLRKEVAALRKKREEKQAPKVPVVPRAPVDPEDEEEDRTEIMRDAGAVISAAEKEAVGARQDRPQPERRNQRSGERRAGFRRRRAGFRRKPARFRRRPDSQRAAPPRRRRGLDGDFGAQYSDRGSGADRTALRAQQAPATRSGATRRLSCSSWSDSRSDTSRCPSSNRSSVHTPSMRRTPSRQ